MTIDKNDPRLTAFALGELSPEEAAELQAAVEKDPELAAEVEGIREVADKLKTTLAAEPLPKAEAVQVAKTAKKEGRLWRRLALYGSGVAALLVVAALITSAGTEARKTARRAEAVNSRTAFTMSERKPDVEPLSSVRSNTKDKELLSDIKHDITGNAKNDQELVQLEGQLKSCIEKKDDAGFKIAEERLRKIRAKMPVLAEKIPASGKPSSSNTTQNEPLPFAGRTSASSGPYVTPPAEQPIYGLSKPPQGGPTQTGSRMVSAGVDSEVGIDGSIPRPESGANVSLGRPTQSLKMMVTPRIIIAEEEEERIGEQQSQGERNVVVGMESPSIFSADLDIPFRRDDSFRNRTGPHNTEAYDKIIENEFKRVSEHPLSTFSIDVDTAGYSMVRKMLAQGRMPVPGAVRLEELINYFDYNYEPPTDGKPFATHVDAARCPWDEKHNLVRIGLKGRVIDKKERDPANLVFLLDVSGSMDEPNKLPLLKDAMKMLVENLNAKDRVAIVVYAGASGMVLPSTPCGDKQKILESLDRLQAGGSTNGGAGIKLAYATAAGNYIEGGVNRVILCTDGDFNVGTTNQSELVDMIEKKAKEGVFLTVLGFGMGNYKDSTLEKLADKGNGNYGYVDTKSEAKKLLVEGLSGTLVTIAKDVKIQVEFNPRHVKAYRLLGYENRMLKKEDFNDDTKDAGEIGAGHTVTALYEIIPADTKEELATPKVDDLKYQKPVEKTDAAGSQEMLTVKLRYKEPDGQKSKLLEFPVKNQIAEFDAANADLRFASSVAAFGMILRGSQFKGDADYDKVVRWAKSSLGEDRFNYREEFLKLVRAAKSLDNN